MKAPDPRRLFSITAAAEDAPDHPALLTDRENWTFARLAERVAAVAAEINPETDRYLIATNQVESLLRLYALMDLGIPAVLLHPRWTEAERRRVMGEGGGAPPVFPGRVKEGTGEDFSPPLALLFTSGSTGTPKGVVLTRAAFAASAAASAANLGWEADDRWLLAMPTAHVGGLSIVTRCLAARKTVVLDTTSRFDPRETAERIEHHRVTLLSLVPTMLHRLLEMEPRWQPPEALRAVLLGGAPAAPALLHRAAERRVPILTTYGMTETCSQVATQSYVSRREPPREDSRQDHGAGPPLPGVEARIAADGEIQLRGPMVMRGYFPAGAHPSPFTADGWLRTGDAGFLDSAGRLHPLGRQGEMLLTGGENVYPAEVEAALLEHPAIAAACVVGVPDPEWGETVAALLVADGPPPTEAALAAWLKERLAPFKQPRRWRWVRALPWQPNGKVERRKARELLAPKI
jgi:o-succinylbenzoate---CoA ligase